MKKILSIILCLVLLAGSMTTACAEEDSFLGEYEGNTYRNEPAGISFLLPVGWSFLSKETIMASAGIADDAPENEAFFEALGKGDQLIIMQASSADGSSVNIIAMPMEKIVYDACLKMGDRAMLETMAPSVVKTYNDAGMTVSSYEIDTLPLHEGTKDCIKVTVSIFGMELYLIQFLQVREECLFAVTACTMDGTAGALNGFTVRDR